MCIACMYVCAAHMYLVLGQVRRRRWIPRELELEMVMEHQVDAGSRSQAFNKKCP